MKTLVRQKPTHPSQISWDPPTSGPLPEALEGIDAVVHLVALVGVGQSMYQIAEYTSVNNLGTAILLQAIAARPVLLLRPLPSPAPCLLTARRTTVTASRMGR